MKLYYSPGACSLSPHIVAREAGITLDLVKVDLSAKRTADGEDYLAINPKGYVPAVRLDNGEVLTEGPAIVQYLGDLKPESGLAPASGTPARYRLQEMLGYINSELHKAYSVLFSTKASEEFKDDRRAYLQKRYALLDGILAKQTWLLGEQFTAADAYLFTVTRWARATHVDLSGFPAVLSFQQRAAERPAVHAALDEEGLLKKHAPA